MFGAGLVLVKLASGRVDEFPPHMVKVRSLTFSTDVNASDLKQSEADILLQKRLALFEIVERERDELRLKTSDDQRGK